MNTDAVLKLFNSSAAKQAMACRNQLRLALTSFKARSGFVDDVYAALTTNQLAIAMTAFERFQRILDLHVTHQCVWPLRGIFLERVSFR
jgi:hypothetical protein